ncbi:unnamed protein product [Camellia sinensis]
MENKTKIKIAFTIATIACFAAISVFITAQYRKQRKQKQQSRSTCYLKTEPKPQDAFKRVLADNSFSPFKHLNHNKAENLSSEHPYKAEIEALLKSDRVEFEFVDDGNVDLELSDSYVWIEKESQLQELADVLSKERVFAVDTEQHSLRSFLGFTALIQISTRREDFLVDTIALHDVMGILRPVFANPANCKVFHGADNDVLWLQRDFHIYIVNLFDTAKACDVLLKPQKSLAYLLETYCGVITNKQLQREDWRQRPLPVEMVQYALTDAHYLLYIAHCLASELIQQDSGWYPSEMEKKIVIGLLHVVLSENSASPDDKFRFVLEASRRSNAICLQLFSKEIEASPGESAASSIISRNLNDQGGLSSHFSDTQFQDLVRRLCTWRDLMARVHDESLRYVLSDHAIISLVHKVPASETEIYDSVSQADLNIDSSNLTVSLQSPSPVICSHLEDFDYLFQDEINNLEDIFQLILQNHLGPNGSCPLTVYNYALLSRNNLILASRLVSKQNGFRNAKQLGSMQMMDGYYAIVIAESLSGYLRRDLAKIVDENPPAIMLLFEPKGRPEDEDNDFYIHSKKNICVGCGEGNHYLRYRIIPSCYRMHFPEHLKSHRSHDIVLLCVDCHEIAHAAAEKYKKKIAAEFGIPLFVRKVVDSRQTQDASGTSASHDGTGVSPLQLRTAAMALLRHGQRMPSNRREELIQIVMKYYGGREISEEDLERALLVGMTPHERRRLVKKRGSAYKKSTKSVIPEEQESCDSLASTGKTCSKEDSNLLAAEDMDVSSFTLCSDLDVNAETLADNNEVTDSDRSRVYETKCISIVDTDVNESISPSNGTVNSVSDGTISPKHNPKLSLLGHGPHGKQVVDHLLKGYGEDGISQFCQRWRQVFVEAVHPHFLPAGWDVMHSSLPILVLQDCKSATDASTISASLDGRRDFGEYSVYNPAKKVSATAQD